MPRLGQAVGEHLEARHVAPGEAGAGDHAPGQSGPEPRCQVRQADEPASGEQRTQHEDVAGIDPVRHRGEEGTART